MGTIICFDYHGKAYQVDESKITQRVSAYGIYIKNKKVLMIKDHNTQFWDLPRWRN